jgi:outer membrane protein TolC
VRAAFYDVVAAQEREKVIRANLDRLAEITRILSEREKQGEGSTYDRLRAERERAEIETELLTAGAKRALTLPPCFQHGALRHRRER